MDKLNSGVSQFLDETNHPLRTEIDFLRNMILSTNEALVENIKWNGPNYCFHQEDRITMKIQPPKNIQLIFHRGAKKLEQPKEKIIQENSLFLVWKENDRAIATFKNMADIKASEADLIDTIKKWIEATK